eukprot:gnl/MRDRNA2_/MRDRNA2_17385_c0_seq1.p1 gnl/MRDRNA2_/MRDRNA2_17385_c0~~gnl/MRDRNA2_/MRDRNA2_17385_c0_seq1.p1  ORF type:complete len:393 (+),score=71.89 gnl/MRDRNA2_/MRDRNA2_17385_c0_seq1:92-1180(+)
MPPRPSGAVGTFLRIVTVNDVYDLKNYARVASAVDEAKASASQLDCAVFSCLNGDFLSPCVLTSIDGGASMMKALNFAKIDYACLGNHEFDIGFHKLKENLEHFNGKCVNSNVTNPELKHLPKYSVFKVGMRTALIAGLCTGDADIYLPANKPTAIPIPEACAKVWEEAKLELGSTPHVFLPMTHQSNAQDVDTAVTLSKHSELSNRTPVLLAGHDHTPSYDRAGNSVIIKVGQDAEQIGIVDVWWTKDGFLRSSHIVRKAEEFPEEAAAAAWISKQQKFLEEAMGVAITTVPKAFSSKQVRYEASGAASFLLDMIKHGLRDSSVELCLIHGGGVRGKADYAPGPFRLGDLFNEFGFPSPWQ